jgi:hypothetical protein
MRGKIHGLIRDDLRLVVELPAEVEDDRERHVDVRREEPGWVESTVEGCPSVEEDDDSEADEDRPCEVRLAPRVEGQDVARHALDLHALVEPQEGDGNTPPCDHGTQSYERQLVQAKDRLNIETNQ